MDSLEKILETSNEAFKQNEGFTNNTLIMSTCMYCPATKHGQSGEDSGDVERSVQTERRLH